jgi:hypothetical protein
MKPLDCDRGTQGVAADALEPVTLAGRNDQAGMQAEPVGPRLTRPAHRRGTARRQSCAPPASGGHRRGTPGAIAARCRTITRDAQT